MRRVQGVQGGTQVGGAGVQGSRYRGQACHLTCLPSPPLRPSCPHTLVLPKHSHTLSQASSWPGTESGEGFWGFKLLTCPPSPCPPPPPHTHTQALLNKKKFLRAEVESGTLGSPAGQQLLKELHVRGG